MYNVTASVAEEFTLLNLHMSSPLTVRHMMDHVKLRLAYMIFRVKATTVICSLSVLIQLERTAFLAISLSLLDLRPGTTRRLG